MKKHWKIIGILVLAVLAALMIFAPWPKDESPDPITNGVNGPAFSTPLRPGYGAPNPFH